VRIVLRKGLFEYLLLFNPHSAHESNATCYF
jgi:hypothetical protein